jgi:hypothetical protein
MKTETCKLMVKKQDRPMEFPGKAFYVLKTKIQMKVMITPSESE